ncbi:winged helix-turn-helix domain-containing protein [Streptomyces noursei]|nr:winged helix-turn-helix domain-containing protein [Streptomyces noursei]
MAAQPDPPYRRIADEIARRIADGTLAPGDRVPSTRRIAREWGVALATATKALTTLRLEGLVEARPGSAPWWRPGAGRRRRSTAPHHAPGAGHGPA